MVASKPSSESRRHARLVRALLIAGLLATATACSTRSLLLVQSCPDGGAGPCGSLPSTALLRGLVGLWHFDEAKGSTIARDSSGLGNDGTLMTLDPSKAWDFTGISGGALQTGGAGYVRVPLSPSIAGIVAEVTVTGWIYLESTITDDWATVASRQIGSGIEQYYHVSVRVTGTPGAFVNTTVPVNMLVFLDQPIVAPLRTWIHLAETYDGSMARVYVDGALVKELALTGTFGADTTPLILGGNGNANTVSELPPGRIEEIALYDRALPADEIQQLAAGALVLYVAPGAAALDAGGTN